MAETTQEERDELRDDPNPQPEDVRRVINDADRLQRAEELLQRWKLSDEAGDKGLMDMIEYERLIQERDAFLGGHHDG